MRLTGQRNQCPTCGEYFNRTSGFTRHRVGKYEPPQRRCLTVEEMTVKGFSKNAEGFWCLPANSQDRKWYKHAISSGTGDAKQTFSEDGGYYPTLGCEKTPNLDATS